MPLGTLASATSHDDNSGQVFYETIFKPHRARACRRSEVLDLIRRQHGKTGATGTASLFDTALNTALAHWDLLTAEELDGLPWHIGRRLWRKRERIRIRSPHEAIPRLRFWKALAATYPDEQELKYIRESDEAPKFAFSTIVETLTCGLPGLGKGPSSSGMGLTWLTCLMISKVPVSRAEIMSLSSLHNLRALDVCGYELQCEIPYGSTQKPLDIDDSVIRNMGRRAQDTSLAFSQLSVLILRYQPGITHRCLQYLSMFPVLSLFGVRDCRLSEKDNEVAKHNGWTCRDSDGLASLQKDIHSKDTWDGPIRSCLEWAAIIPLESRPPEEHPLIIPEHLAEVYNRHGCPPGLVAGPDKDQKQPPMQRVPVSPALDPDRLVTFRIGHTPNQIIFSQPLCFFRTLPYCETHTRKFKPGALPTFTQTGDESNTKRQSHFHATLSKAYGPLAPPIATATPATSAESDIIFGSPIPRSKSESKSADSKKLFPAAPGSKRKLKLRGGKSTDWTEMFRMTEDESKDSKEKDGLAEDERSWRDDP